MLGAAYFAPLSLASKDSQECLAGLAKSLELTRNLRNELVTSLRTGEPNAYKNFSNAQSDLSAILAGDLRSFEDDIIALMDLGDPTLFSTKFKEKWHLSDRQYEDVISFYAIRIWEENTLRPLGSADRRRFIERLRFLRYADRINNSLQPLTAPTKAGTTARDYFIYFHKNITQLSVPQMAGELGLNESQVYALLSELQISISRKWNQTKYKPLFEEIGKLIAPIDQGDLRKIAARYNVGSQALEFFLHYERTIQREKIWTEVEVQNLTKLRLLGGLSIAEISTKLSRTEASISYKLSDLGIVQTPQRGQDLIVIPPHGALKESGILQLAPIIDFVLSHNLKERDFLAQILDVERSSLNQFIEKHKIEFLFDDAPAVLERTFYNEGLAGTAATQASRAVEIAEKKYRSQRELVASVLKLSESDSVVDLNEVLNTVAYIDYFDSKITFLEVLTEQAEKVNKAHLFNTLAIKLKQKSDDPIYERLRAINKKHVTARVLEFVKKNPNTDFQWSKGGEHSPFANPMEFMRVVGNGTYRKGPTVDRNHLRVFDSPSDFFLHIYKEGKTKGIAIDLTAVSMWSDYTYEYSELLKELWIEKVLKFIQQSNGTNYEWTLGGKNTPFNSPWEFKTVTGMYNAENVLEKPEDAPVKTVFNSGLDFYVRLYRDGKKRGIEVDLSKIEIRKAYTSEYREVLQDCWKLKIIRFLRAHPNTNFAWSNGGENTPFIHSNEYGKVLGKGPYSIDSQNPGPYGDFRVFENSRHFWREIRKAIDEDPANLALRNLNLPED